MVPSQVPTEDTRRAGQCHPQLHILQGSRETSQQRVPAWTTHHFGCKGRTRGRWQLVVRPGVGRGGVPARRTFPSSRTGSVSLQETPKAHTLAKGEDRFYPLPLCQAAAQHQPSLGHTGELAPTPCSFPPGWKNLLPVATGSQHTPSPNLLGPLNPAEHPLPTQTQQPESPGDSVESK